MPFLTILIFVFIELPSSIKEAEEHEEAYSSEYEIERNGSSLTPKRVRSDRKSRRSE